MRRKWREPVAGVGAAITYVIVVGTTAGWDVVISWEALGGVFAVVGVVLGVVGLLHVRGDAQQLEKLIARSTPSLSHRIENLRDNLKASEAIIAEITAEMNVQTTALDRIRAEAEHNRALAALHKDEADAVKRLVEETIHTAQSTTAKQGKRQQWLFFLSGLLLGIPLSILANFVYDLLK